MFIGLMLAAQSKIVWYDYRTLATQAGEDFELLQSLIYWSLALLLFAVYFLGAHLQRYLREPFIIILLSMNGLGALLGLALGNSPMVVLQDVWKYLFPVIGFVAASTIIERYGIANPLKWLFLVTFAAMVIRLGYFAFERGSIFGVRYGGVLELFSIAYASAMFVQRTGPSQWFYLAALAAALGLIFLGEKRTTVLLAGLMVSFSYVILLAKGKIGFGFFIPTFAAFLALFAIAIGIIDLSAGFDALGKLNPDDILDFSGEVRREIEIQTVAQSLKDYPLGIFFGFGSGAEFQLPTFFTKTLQEFIHSVHFTPAAMVYRHGLFGVCVYLFIAFYGLRFSLANNGDPNAGAINAAALYKVGAFLASLAIYGLVDDFLIGVCTAVLVWSKRTAFYPAMRAPNYV